MSKSLTTQSDQFLNSQKQQCRINNINLLSNTILMDNDIPNWSWCELMGDSGIETLKLLEERKILRPNGFIGVDTNKNHILDHKKSRPDLQWYANDIFQIIHQLNDVAVFNFDTYGNIDIDPDYRDLSNIIPLIKQSRKKFGQFVLFYNKDLDGVSRQKKNRGKTLRNHTNRICEVFNEYLFNRKFDTYDLLPKNAEDQINEGFTGIIGAYEIYKGEDRRHRMANLRLIFG